jgi:hypothetical protein
MPTVTGTLESAANSAPIVGTVEVMLCGYGSRVPRMNGAGLTARISTANIPVSSNGTFSFTVVANDEIAPAGTYYTVTIRDDNGDISQVNAYLFTSNNSSYDLNLIDPYDPNQPPPPLPPLLVNQLINVGASVGAVFPLNLGTAFKMVLPGDVTAPVFQGQLPGNLYTFIFQQDATGGWNFTWPSDAYNGSGLDHRPNAVTVQTFVCDEDLSLYAIAGATYYL